MLAPSSGRVQRRTNYEQRLHQVLKPDERIQKVALESAQWQTTGISKLQQFPFPSRREMGHKNAGI